MLGYLPQVFVFITEHPEQSLGISTVPRDERPFAARQRAALCLTAGQTHSGLKM